MGLSDMGRNLLLGKGENLVSTLPPPRRGMEKRHPYINAEDVYGRLLGQFGSACSILDALADEYCPEGKTVFKVDLHPTYFAKSYFPQALFNRFDLKVIGSRKVGIRPANLEDQEDMALIPTHELFVSGTRESIHHFRDNITQPELFENVRKIERIAAFQPGERIKGNSMDLADCQMFELVLHSDNYDETVVSAFVELAERHGAHVLSDKRMQASGLCFLPVMMENYTAMEEIEPFSFLRVARRMPKLRPLPRGFTLELLPSPLPDIEPCTEIKRRVAVFDVGSDGSRWLNGWVRHVNLLERCGNPDEVLHGTLVNSALLFGSHNGASRVSPVAAIDSYQVVSPSDTSNGLELYEALERICQAIDTNEYEFANLSLGPDLPIDDDEVHAWTAKLDEKTANGNLLLSVAVGNNGQSDWRSGNARIEVPSDSVNVLGVGASTASGDSFGWDRTPYSAIGPGRQSGVHKPDVLDFGGDKNNKFKCIYLDGMNVAPAMGTSFAAPNALRKCIALRSRFPELRPLALKALLVHAAVPKDAEAHRMELHGHGSLPEELDRYVVCGEGEMTVVYQGILDSSKYVKALIPVPDNLDGMVTLKATLCYASEVNPQTPENYTKCGLEVVLRPNSSKETNDAQRPRSKAFFDRSDYETEAMLQRDGLKWNTVLHGEKTMRASSSIDKPFFEIHCNSRDGLGYDAQPRQVPYALVVTVVAPKNPRIYEDVVQAYAAKITPIVENTLTVPAQVAV